MIDCIEQESLELRRSIYQLGNTPMVSDSCLIETISACLKNCPSPFNAQSARLVILFKEYHHQFWDLVWKKLSAAAPANKQKTARERILAFRNAYGTILFFEDQHILTNLKKQYPLYKHNMHDWVMQSNGILQYMIWQTLAENDEGASLQHYNELIEKELNSWLELPKNWKIVAQMPWGNIEKEAGAKTFEPLETRMKIFK